MADAVITTAPARAPAAPGTWRQRVWQPVWEYRAQLASLSVGLGLMEILGRWLHFPFLPPVSAVIIAAWQMILSGEILGNLAVSLVGACFTICLSPFSNRLGQGLLWPLLCWR